MAKITKKHLEKARAYLATANGKRRERIISEADMIQLIAAAEKLYKDNARKKYFAGVEAKMVGAAYSMPRAYGYRADMTAVYVNIRKGRPPVIQVTRAPWSYLAQDAAYSPRVIWE